MVAGYARAKAEREVIDHGDQVALAARIAARHPEVGAAERGRYQVVLLDEYQDTSHAQLVLLRALFGGGHPVTAVGDPCQSIYGWRGASAGNLRRFGRDFPVVTGSGRAAGPVRPRCACCPPASGTPAGSLTWPRRCRRGLRAAAPEVPRLVPPPGRAGRGRVICALTETAATRRPGSPGRSARCWRCLAGVAPDGQPWPDGRDGPACTRATSRSCAASGPSSPRCGRRSRPAASRSRWSASAGCSPSRGGRHRRHAAGAARSRRLRRRWPGCSPAPRWRIGPRDLVALGKRARALAREQRRSPVAGTLPGPRGQPAGRPGQDRRAGDPAWDEDPLAKAITDLTADPGSLVEALDDLGDPAALLGGRPCPPGRAGRRAA